MMTSGRIVSAKEGLCLGILDDVSAGPFADADGLMEYATSYVDKYANSLSIINNIWLTRNVCLFSVVAIASGV